MKKLSFIIATALLTSSCATIFGKTDYPVSLTSTPSGAKVSIVNEEGNKVFEGITPAQAILKSGESYFDKKDYTITFDKSGFEQKTALVSGELNPWYFGNILIGGVIGMLIVDPLTGAMFKIKQENITTELDKKVASNGGSRILTLSEVPESARQYLVRVN